MAHAQAAWRARENSKRASGPPRRVDGEGTTPSALMAIGEGPGEVENVFGRPFIGPTGDELASYFYKCDLRRDDWFITNMVRYRCVDKNGKNRRPTPEELERDEPSLLAEIAECRPRIIATMGGTPTRWLLGDVDMQAVYGIPYRLRDLPANMRGPGWQILMDLAEAYDFDPIIVPSFHPAAGLHSPDLAPWCFESIRQLAAVVRGEKRVRNMADPFPNPDYGLARPEDLPAFYGKYFDIVAIDTEGTLRRPYRPWCLSFSTRAGYGRVILANNPEMLALFGQSIGPNTRIILHNAIYDLGVLAVMGVHIPWHQFTDSMVKAFLLRLEPQGLKNLARRHCGIAMVEFEEMSGPIEHRLAMEYLESLVAGDRTYPKPEQYVVWEDGEPKIKTPQPLHQRVRSILHDIASGKVDKEGNPPDPRKRWFEIGNTVRADGEREFGPMPSFSMDLLDFDTAVTYACRDADATFRVDPILTSKIQHQGLDEILQLNLDIIPMLDRMQEMGMPISRPRFAWLQDHVAGLKEKYRAEIMAKWTGGEWFNPNSSAQVAALIFKKLRIQPLRGRIKYTPGGALSTTDKVIEPLRNRHPVMPPILDYRGAEKTESSFAIPIPEMADEDDRIRGFIRGTRVTSGRISMTDFNLTAVPTRELPASLTRWACALPDAEVPDHVLPYVAQFPQRDLDPRHINCELVSVDLQQIEMKVMASLSRDPVMIDLFLRGADMHVYTATQMFGVTEADVLANKKKYREPAKRIGFGVITGISGIGLYDQMAMMGIDMYSPEDYDQMILDWFKVYKGVRVFLNDCRAEARRTGMVKSWRGMPRYLPGIWSPSPAIRAESERASHSHIISASAQDVLKRAMVRIEAFRHEILADNPDVTFEPLVQVHDELIFQLSDWLYPVVEQPLLDMMSADSPHFLVPITASISKGKDWGVLK